MLQQTTHTAVFSREDACDESPQPKLKRSPMPQKIARRLREFATAYGMADEDIAQAELAQAELAAARRPRREQTTGGGPATSSARRAERERGAARREEPLRSSRRAAVPPPTKELEAPPPPERKQCDTGGLSEFAWWDALVAMIKEEARPSRLPTCVLPAGYYFA